MVSFLPGSCREPALPWAPLPTVMFGTLLAAMPAIDEAFPNPARRASIAGPSLSASPSRSAFRTTSSWPTTESRLPARKHVGTGHFGHGDRDRLVDLSDATLCIQP